MDNRGLVEFCTQRTFEISELVLQSVFMGC